MPATKAYPKSSVLSYITSPFSCYQAITWLLGSQRRCLNLKGEVPAQVVLLELLIQLDHKIVFVETAAKLSRSWRHSDVCLWHDPRKCNRPRDRRRSMGPYQKRKRGTSLSRKWHRSRGSGVHTGIGEGRKSWWKESDVRCSFEKEKRDESRGLDGCCKARQRQQLNRLEWVSFSMYDANQSTLSR